MDGKEFSTVETRELASLIEALCEVPLDGQAEVSAELQALRREAAKALLGATGADTGTEQSADQLTAALAALLSGSDAEAARQALADPATRLDAESALAFFDAVERSAEVAPSHLVEELVSAKASLGGATAPNLWLRMAESFWPARHWRVVGACAVMLVASAGALTIYWEESNPSVAKSHLPDSTPAVAAGGAPAALSPASAPPPALAETQACEPSSKIKASAAEEGRSPAPAQTANTDSLACNSVPGSQLADTAVKEALEKAEGARQAATERAATDAAGKVGAAKTSREPIQADRMFGAPADRPAAAARSAPSALPARPAASGLR